MEKLKVSKEQAAALDSIKRKMAGAEDRDIWGSVGNVIKYRMKHIFATAREAANDLTIDELITALVVGYEIKVDPIQESKEKVLKEMEELRDLATRTFMATDSGTAAENRAEQTMKAASSLQFEIAKLFEKAGI